MCHLAHSESIPEGMFQEEGVPEEPQVHLAEEEEHTH